MSTPLDADALRASPLVATLELHGTLPSTNDRAKRLAAEPIDLPALVVADRQTAGRGRGANRWHASEGSLTFSLLIDPAAYGVPPERAGLLSLATAVAVIDAVRRVTGAACGYKWPNDVLIDGKKLAGVLLESPRPGRMVIGVGVNVENELDSAPAEVQARATSLANFPRATRQAVLSAFLEALQSRLSQLGSADPSPVEAARAACVLTGKPVAIFDGQRTRSGTCRGLDNTGALLLEVPTGAVERCLAGTVSW